MTTEIAGAHEMSVIDAIYHRRSVRRYRADPVDESMIGRLLDAAVHAPTAIHREPWAFVIVQDRAVLRRVSARAVAQMHAEASAHRDLLRAPGVVPAGQHLDIFEDPDFNIFYDAGTLIVICGTSLGQFVVADCWLAAENLMLTACALGLGTCCIGSALPTLNTPEVKREFGIPDGTDAVAAVIVGVPQGETPPVPRKPPEILRWLRAPVSELFPLAPP